MFYRGFYLPDRGSYRENFVDAPTQEELPPDAILILQINEDGTREVIFSAKEDRKLTKKEDQFHDFAERQTEFKSDGGDTPEMRQYRRENKV